MIEQSWQEKNASYNRKVLMIITLLLTSISLALRIFGFKKLFTFLGRHSKSQISQSNTTKNALQKAKKIAAMVTHTNRNWSLYMVNCLPESLTLWCFLRWQGIPAEFKLGIRTITGPFESHTWVEFNGVVLNDSQNINQIFNPLELHYILQEIEET